MVVSFLLGAAAFAVPATLSARRAAAQVACANHLRQVGQAVRVYGQDNRGAWPRTRAANGDGVRPTWGTGAAATQPFADDGPELNDVTASLFLLLRTTDTAPITFVCPATDGRADDFAGRDARERSNFTDWRRNLSYSYANPFPDRAALERSHARNLIRRFAGSEFAYAADRNPGASAVNSPNHRGRGQNVLYGDGRVEWCQSRNVGVNRDDVYLNADGNVVASPVDVTDSLLLPPDRDPKPDDK